MALRFKDIFESGTVWTEVDESFYTSAFDDYDVPSVYEVLSEFEANRREVLGHDTDISDFGGDLDAYGKRLEREHEVLLSNSRCSGGSGRFAMQWRLIPADQYRRALEMFVRQGPETFRFSESVLRDWLGIVFTNLEYLQLITMLCGHDMGCDYDSVRNFYFDENSEEESELGDSLIHDWESMWDFLEARGFDVWETLPDGTDAISDYGIRPVSKILDSLPDEPDASEMIVALNRCLDVVHQRGDLASAFIEGGSGSLSSISG